MLKYVDAFNSGDSDALRQIFANDTIVQGVLGQGGMEKVMGIWRDLHQAFAIKLNVEEMIAEGDPVAVRYTRKLANSSASSEETNRPANPMNSSRWNGSG